MKCLTVWPLRLHHRVFDLWFGDYGLKKPVGDEATHKRATFQSLQVLTYN